jgi:hypothetical protein
MKMLAKAGAGIRQWSQYAVVRAVFGSGTLFTLLYVSNAGGHWT